MKSRLFFLSLLMVAGNAFSAPDLQYAAGPSANLGSWELVAKNSMIHGFTFTFGVFMILKVVSYGIQLIRHCLEAPNDAA